MPEAAWGCRIFQIPHLGGKRTLIQEEGDDRRTERIVQWDHSNERLDHLQPTVVWEKTQSAAKSFIKEGIN